MSTAKKRNDDTFKFRIPRDELEVLHAIARLRCISASAVVRELVRREHGRTFKASTKRKVGAR